jgi:transcriptional regulator with XRE-family HTH domain
VTSEYRKRFELTYRAFAEALNEHLVNTGISHQSVMNWEKGITDPGTDFLLNCLVVYPMNDWRTQWAIDCLCAKLPVVFDRDEERKLLILSAAASRGRGMVAQAG